ncbi:hypothetical protein PFY01_03225 [Brevundimonas vesicularis]|uniref:hypothetical protein n=1 Tax=Brevundimonas vesicularis TaxID=41276 RepID=UPI0022EC651B|nr:hypothetical protein [Brevundimonas vesicularis]WBT06707.1 hypothetical protein PFY01_03225 [Brevundimonas vesicularis]
MIGASLAVVFVPNGDVAAFIQHPATAAWIQALGSIAAIVGTWAVGERQAAHARALRDADDRSRLKQARIDRETRRESIRAIASAFADLTVERLRSCEVMLADKPEVADAESLSRDLSYTRQLLMDFKVADLGSAREMLIFSSFAGLLGEALAAVDREVAAARRSLTGWLPAFGTPILTEVRIALEVALERRTQLAELFDADRAAEAFHAED